MAEKVAINLEPSAGYVDRFSLARVVGDTVYVSGHGPLKGGKVVGRTIEEQTELTLENMRELLAEVGCTLDDCVKMSVYLLDLSDYDRFNATYRKFFDHPLPARTVVRADLLFGIRIEIDAIAVRPERES